MHIYFDLDNTIIDDTGEHLRPGIVSLLEWCLSQGHILSLWTGSTEERSKLILDQLKLKKYFTHTVFREDYDPDCEGLVKNIKYLNGDLLIDDDPVQISHVKTLGKAGLQITPFLSTVQKLNRHELEGVKKYIIKLENRLKTRGISPNV